MTGQDGRTAIVEPQDARSLVIRIEMTPSRDLSPNGRVHYMRKYRAAEGARIAAYYAARVALGPGGMTDPVRCLQTTPGTVRIDWLVRWGKGQKRWDDDNLIAGCKAFRDGIAECLGMDDRRFSTGSVVQDRDPDGLGYVLVAISTS